MERWSRRFFSLLMRNSNITVIDITELAQMLLSAWSGHSECGSGPPAAHVTAAASLQHTLTAAAPLWHT